VLLDGRSALVCALLAVLLLAVGAVTLTTGDFPVPLGAVVRELTGRGTDPQNAFVIRTLRLPRLLTALLAGAALGVAGALFQSLTRNPLGSPDVIGFNSGAATGALVVILVLHGSNGAISAGAVIGGLATALAVHLLTLRRGSTGLRLVLVGLGAAAMLESANSYLLTRASLDDAQSASVWLVGSLNGRGWEYVRPLSLVLLVLLPAAVVLARGLGVMEMGDDLGRSLGLRAERLQAGTVLVAVGLSAVATAAAGPISFVALAAPQIARRLTGVPGVNTVPAALTGAVLLTGSDLAAQHVFGGGLPVGVVTAAVGGLYLAWLLSREWSGGRG
jgi:iron complex transport system permease protein